MKFINITINKPSSEVLEYISDSERVNENVHFDEKEGTPFMHLKEKDGKLKIRCEMMNRPTKDNAALEGTYFKGKISETAGTTRIKGVILTAPIYHAICMIPLIAAIVFAFWNPAILSVPALFVASEFIMFSREFKKQGYIQRYLLRAARKLEERSSTEKA